MTYLVPVHTIEKKGKKEKRLLLNFIDSLQFMSASLCDLVKNCPNLPLTISTLPGSTEVKNGKGVFPYNYLDSEEKLLETKLPPKSAFFNKLTQNDITDEEYALAQQAWVEFQCTTFADYTAGKNFSSSSSSASVNNNSNILFSLSSS